MTSRTGREIRLKKRPSGFVMEDDFELVEVEIPKLRNEDEFLIRNIWMSVDPFMRIYLTKGSKPIMWLKQQSPLVLMSSCLCSSTFQIQKGLVRNLSNNLDCCFVAASKLTLFLRSLNVTVSCF
jgi:N-terminal domain of oxidoreductase